MTLRIRRILVPIGDLQAVPRAALRLAASVAAVTKARIELFHAVAPTSRLASRAPRQRRQDSFSPPTPGDELQQAQRRLERIATSAWAEGCRVASSVAADAPPHEAIVRRALASRADLVIAATHAHRRIARLFLRNTDWELIRYCPCPLLLARSGTMRREPSILVAVDPFHAHAKPARLDAQLLAVGNGIAHVLGGSVHLFHAYMPLTAYVEGTLGEPVLWESAEIEEVHGAQIRRGFNRLADQAGIPRSRRHLVMGDVRSELADAVRRLHASLVVMGAVSRSGLRRLFIGSTAERVLDQLRCDILIVKPRGFETQVPRKIPR